ncbi:hypothetical protein [Stackebrandtia soli]|uniref:hypothetical protein n=1 Tax=Stackebrandtia soli TaxID=1892856 RepID=UPI0039EB2AC8
MASYTLLPGLSMSLITEHALRLGADPETAVTVHHSGGRMTDLINALRAWNDHGGYLRAAERLGVPRDEAEDLWWLLRSRHLLVAADALPGSGAGGILAVSQEALALAYRRDSSAGTVLARRRGHRVLVNGAGELSARLCEELRRSGVGRVWSGADHRHGIPTFSIVVNASQPPSLTAKAHRRRGLPHLVVDSLEGSVYIGPLVVPGRTPCIHCVELHCRDEHPEWSRARFGEAPDTTVEAALEALAVAVTTTLALQHIDGEVVDGPTTLRMRPSMSMRRREWPVHPLCRCVDQTATTGTTRIGAAPLAALVG